MRSFQYSDAKSHKFWNIEVSGKSFTVTYGKIGTAGQSQSKSFPSADKAQSEADKLIKEKTAKGYVETTPSSRASDADAFERAILSDPRDQAPWCAYADYLADRGDVRGEFMQVQIALELESRSKAERAKLKKQEAALLKQHERGWLGPLAAFTIDAPPPKYEWIPKTTYSFRNGWLTDLSFGRIGVEEARAAIRMPGTQFLQSLATVGPAYEAPEGSAAPDYIDGRYKLGPDLPDPPGDNPALHVLVKHPHLSSVRVFRLGNPVTAEYEDSGQCHSEGELAYHFVKQMPQIEELYLLAHRVDANKIYALPMPNLRVLMHYHAHEHPFEKLAANTSLTNLTHLYTFPHGLEPEAEEPYLRLRHLRAICRAAHLKNLTHLRLRAADFGDAGAKELVESGALKHLKYLDLQYGCMSDEGARRLADCPDIRNLEHLDLSNNALTSDGIKALKKTGVNLIANEMHQLTRFDPDEDNEFLWMGDPE